MQHWRFPFPMKLKLPLLADLRESACLLLLCGTMIFSVLNIGVHRLAERLWEPINHGLSPDGKEYVSISLAGIRVHDAESGHELQRKSWRSPWGEPPRLDWLGQFHEDAYYLESYDESLQGEIHGKLETAPTLEVAPTRRFVVGKFPGGCLVWWDREVDQVRTTCFPDHILLHCFIDEHRDRILLECIRRPKPYVQRPQDPEPEQPEPPDLLARKIDVIEFRLGTGEEIARHENLRVGAPIDLQFDARLVADTDGRNPRLARWADYPCGTPELTYLTSFEGLDKIGQVQLCRIYLQQHSMVVDEGDKRIHLFPLADGRPSKFVFLDFQLGGSPNWIYSQGVVDGSVADWYNSDLLGVPIKKEPEKYRCFAVDYTSRMSCVDIQDSSGNPSVRAADERGRIYDLPASSEELPAYRQMRLDSFPVAFAISLSTFFLAFGIWLGNAIVARNHFASRGWTILLLALLWPLLLWGLHQGMANGGVAAAMRFILIVAYALILGLLAVLLVTGKPSIRPFCLSLVFVVALFCVCAWSEYFHTSYN